MNMIIQNHIFIYLKILVLGFVLTTLSISNVEAQYPANCPTSDMYIILSEELSPYKTMVIKFDTKADVTATSCLGNLPLNS